MFSVIIPAYNCEFTISEAVRSVYQQTRLDLIDEIIIVNDGSTDNTEESVMRLMNSDRENLIKYMEQENRGASSARNRGILEAKAEWIALLDADDRWKPNKIEVQYAAIEQLDNCCFIGCARYIWSFRKIAKKGIYKLNAYQLCIKSNPTTPSVLFKKSVGVELGLFDENMRYSEDINFFQKFLTKESYYIIVDDLLEVGIQKEDFGSSGVSSNIRQMALGRDKNTRELQEMKLICKPFMYCMLVLNKLKYIRRLALLLKVKGFNR